jgi:hypothetical protein
MTVTVLTITKLELARCFVKNSYTEFHENATKASVSDTASQKNRPRDRTDGRTWSPHQASFLN